MTRVKLTLTVAAIAAIIYTVLAMYVVQIEILTMEQRFVTALCFVLTVFFSGFFTYIIRNDQEELDDSRRQVQNSESRLFMHERTVTDLKRALEHQKNEHIQQLADLRRLHSYAEFQFQQVMQQREQHLYQIESKTKIQIDNGKEIHGHSEVAQTIHQGTTDGV